MRRKILWLPSPPSEGCASMDRYWRELTRQLGNSPLAAFDIRSPFGEPPAHSKKAPRLARIWNKYFRLPWKIRRQGDADVVHILDHSCAHFLTRLPASVRKIVTVHDLAPLEDPDRLTPAQVRRFRATVSNLKGADLLLCDSQYTARATGEFLKRDRDIQVLPLGVNAAQFAMRRTLNPGHSLPACPRILSVGSNLRRKNLGILPDVMRDVKSVIGTVALIRVGERLDADTLASLQRSLGPENVVELGGCSDDDLVALYQNVDLLLFPSTIEGFGLPLLEAMAAGCPVVSSDASSLPEVGGEDALYFRPSRAAEGAAQIIRLLKDPQLRTSLIDRGKQRAALFSWARHAELLAAVYAQAAENLHTKGMEPCDAR